jgi:RHS repeat-associated protein
LNSDGVYNYAYDDEGNLIRRTEIASNKVTEYQWDYRNRLAGVFDKNATGNPTQEVGFKYDAMNRRISKKVGSTETLFVYDRDNVLFDFAVSGANQPVLDKRYFYGTGVDQLLAQESVQGSVLWGLSDQLGTVKDWVNNSGSVANHVRYDSFGGVVSQSNPAFGSRYGFTGREWDAETGLYYYRSRYYNPGIGRFIGEDSVGFDAGDVNLYRYVGNRPVERIDPSGMVSLAYQSAIPLTPLLCGGFTWKVRWQLNGNDASSANGYVVQKIKLDANIQPCPPSDNCPDIALPPLVEKVTYWEAWSVKNGKVYSANGKSAGTDTFGVDPRSELGRRGKLQVEGWAKFIPNYEQPDNWGKTQYAHDLLSTTSKPEGWSDSNSLYRKLTAQFTCCKTVNYTHLKQEVK